MNDPKTGCDIGQGFGGRLNPLYPPSGHPGIDESCGYGSKIKALATGKVYSTFPVEHPASDGYTAVFTLCRTPLETFEFSYGHVSKILCNMGDTIIRDVTELAEEGNKGPVYSGNILITLAMQRAGDKRGSHRHYQKRPTIASSPANSPFLQTANGPYRDNDGHYHQIPMYDNGFNGCVDWQAPLFNHDMKVGMETYDVLLLQRAMVLEGYAAYEPTGYFGVKTEDSVKKYQRAKGLPDTGFAGPMTRTKLNEKYKQLS